MGKGCPWLCRVPGPQTVAILGLPTQLGSSHQGKQDFAQTPVCRRQADNVESVPESYRTLPRQGLNSPCSSVSQPPAWRRASAGCHAPSGTTSLSQFLLSAEDIPPLFHEQDTRVQVLLLELNPHTLSAGVPFNRRGVCLSGGPV